MISSTVIRSPDFSKMTEKERYKYFNNVNSRTTKFCSLLVGAAAFPVGFEVTYAFTKSGEYSVAGGLAFGLLASAAYVEICKGISRMYSKHCK